MAKKDIINSCDECSQFRKAKNAHEKILYFYCELGDEEILQPEINFDVIPDWCPLEDVEN